MRRFFKPTISIGVIFVAIIILTAFLPHTARICSNGPVGVSCSTISTLGFGYPVFFGQQCEGDYCRASFNPLYLVANVVIYYTLSSLIVFSSNKLRRGEWRV
jgi:hypothetical protein